MTTYQLLSLFGIPGVMGAIIFGVCKVLSKLFVRVKALERGTQALLRDRLYQMYAHYSEKEYAPIYARENWSNIYKQYHNLGENGVMDDYNERFLALPTKEEFEKKSK